MKFLCFMTFTIALVSKHVNVSNPSQVLLMSRRSKKYNEFWAKNTFFTPNKANLYFTVSFQFHPSIRQSATRHTPSASHVRINTATPTPCAFPPSPLKYSLHSRAFFPSYFTHSK